MQTAVITVKYINAPRSAKGPASIKDANGTYWAFWVRDIPLSTFQENQSYTIGYETSQYQDKDQYTIKEVIPATPATNTAPRPAAPAFQSGLPQSPPAPHVPPSQKDISISVLALAKPYIELGAIPVEELENLLLKIKAVVQRVF